VVSRPLPSDQTKGSGRSSAEGSSSIAGNEGCGHSEPVFSTEYTSGGISCPKEFRVKKIVDRSNSRDLNLFMIVQRFSVVSQI
jgi:hypothetical protein